MSADWRSGPCMSRRCVAKGKPRNGATGSCTGPSLPGQAALAVLLQRRGAGPDIAPFGSVLDLHEADATCARLPVQLRLRPFSGGNPLLKREAIPHERLSGPRANEHDGAGNLSRHRADALDLALNGLSIFCETGAESPASDRCVSLFGEDSKSIGKAERRGLAALQSSRASRCRRAEASG